MYCTVSCLQVVSYYDICMYVHTMGTYYSYSITLLCICIYIIHIHTCSYTYLLHAYMTYCYHIINISMYYHHHTLVVSLANFLLPMAACYYWLATPLTSLLLGISDDQTYYCHTVKLKNWSPHWLVGFICSYILYLYKLCICISHLLQHPRR